MKKEYHKKKGDMERKTFRSVPDAHAPQKPFPPQPRSNKNEMLRPIKRS